MGPIFSTIYQAQQAGSTTWDLVDNFCFNCCLAFFEAFFHFTTKELYSRDENDGNKANDNDVFRHTLSAFHTLSEKFSHKFTRFPSTVEFHRPL